MDEEASAAGAAAFALAARLLIRLILSGEVPKADALAMLADCEQAMLDQRQPAAQQLLRSLGRRIDHLAPDDPAPAG